MRTYTQEVPGGIEVTFEVFERPTIGYVRFVGHDRVKQKVLLRESGLKVGDPMNSFAVTEGRRKLEEYYRTHGYGQAQVAVLEGTRPEDAGVAYQIHEGPLQRIWQTRFEGNTLAGDRRLKTQIQSKPGILWLFKGKVDQQRIDEDVERLTAYYRALGYFKADIGRELEFDEKNKWLTLTFTVDEGPRYRIRDVRVIGNQKYGGQELLDQLGLKAGDYFHLAKLRRDENTLRDVYGSQGYIAADIKAAPRFHPEPGQLDLVYEIQEGDQYRVGRIFVNIEGDQAHTRQSVVLNRLSIKSGDIVDIREVRNSERRLKASQLFLTDPAQGISPEIVVKPSLLGDDAASIADQGGPGMAPGSQIRGQSPEDPPAAGRADLSLAARRRTCATGRPARERETQARPTWERSVTLARLTSWMSLPIAAVLATGCSAWRPTRPLASTSPQGNMPPRAEQATDATQEQTVLRSQGPYDESRADVNPLSPGSRDLYRYPMKVSDASDATAVRRMPTASPARRPKCNAPNTPHPTIRPHSGRPMAKSLGPVRQPIPRPIGRRPVGPSPHLRHPPCRPRRSRRPTCRRLQACRRPACRRPACRSSGLQSSPAESQPAPSAYQSPPLGLPPGPGDTPLTGPPLTSVPPAVPPDRYADVVVNLQETQTGRIMLGAGINSDLGLTGQIIIDERNFDWQRVPTSIDDVLNGKAFRGAGQGFRVEAMPGREVQRYMVQFTEPYLGGTRVSLNLSGYLYDRRFYDWDEERLGGRLGLGYRLTPDLSLSVGVRGEQVDISDPRVLGVPELDSALGESDLYMGQVTLTHDTRDVPFAPTEGHLVELNLAQAFGSYSFPRAEIDYRRYLLLTERTDGSGRHVLGFSSRVGFTGDDTPLYENFFAGGHSTLRGFEYRGASPKVMGVTVGGEFLLLGSVEYLFPITADDMLKGVLFTDFGTVEEDIDINAEDFRLALGAGIRIFIPAMGPAPIALDFAVPVAQEDTDDEELFSFFIGIGR